MTKMSLLLMAGVMLVSETSAMRGGRRSSDRFGQSSMQWPLNSGFDRMMQSMNGMHRGLMRGYGCGGDDKFTITMDTRNYQPGEVTVSAVRLIPPSLSRWPSRTAR